MTTTLSNNLRSASADDSMDGVQAEPPTGQIDRVDSDRTAISMRTRKLISPEIAERHSIFEALLQKNTVSWPTARPFIKRLGTGGQGTVFLAEHRGAGRFTLPVALKFFSPAGFRDDSHYETEMLRLTEVSAMVARIQEDHLVHVHTFIEHESVFVMEMEWVDGYDLLSLLRRDTLAGFRETLSANRWETLNERVVTKGAEAARFKPGMAVAILRECLQGIAALHRCGIVHCDLKPSNIMLKRTGRVKIIDIGSAYWISRPPEKQSCTLEYAAPEILAGYRATPQADLASLGYVLLEMLSGIHPFAGKSYDEIVYAKRNILDALPRMLPPEEFAFSEPLIRMLQRLIHPDSKQRFRTAEEAELSDEGAAAFLRVLIKSDLADEYSALLRQWIADMEIRVVPESQPLPPIVPGTTCLVPLPEPGDASGVRFDVDNE